MQDTNKKPDLLLLELFFPLLHSKSTKNQQGHEESHDMSKDDSFCLLPSLLVLCSNRKKIFPSLLLYLRVKPINPAILNCFQFVSVFQKFLSRGIPG